MRILNLFNWKLNDVEKQLDIIKQQGFDCVQISTLQPLYVENIYKWWNSCAPKSYSLGNHFGNIDDLISLCKNAQKFDIKIMTEIIPIFNAQIDNQNDNYLISKINYKLLGLGTEELFNLDEEQEVINLLLNLINCGIQGIFLNYPQLKLPSEGSNFVEKLFQICELNNIKMYSYCMNILPNRIDEYNNYFKIVTDFQNYESSSKVKYIESQYSYYDYNFGITKSLSSTQISDKYRDLCEEYENTIYYARPFDDEWKSDKIKEANNIECKKYTKIIKIS